MKFIEERKENLGNVVRVMEETLGWAAQLVVNYGDDQFVIAPLTERDGTYEFLFQNQKEEYGSFAEMKESVESRGLDLRGNDVDGFEFYRESFPSVGVIVYPLLQVEEEIRFKKVSQNE